MIPCHDLMEAIIRCHDNDGWIGVANRQVAWYPAEVNPSEILRFHKEECVVGKAEIFYELLQCQISKFIASRVHELREDITPDCDMDTIVETVETISDLLIQYHWVVNSDPQLMDLVERIKSLLELLQFADIVMSLEN